MKYPVSYSIGSDRRKRTFSTPHAAFRFARSLPASAGAFICQPVSEADDVLSYHTKSDADAVTVYVGAIIAVTVLICMIALFAGGK